MWDESIVFLMKLETSNLINFTFYLLNVFSQLSRNDSLLNNK